MSNIALTADRSPNRLIDPAFQPKSTVDEDLRDGAPDASGFDIATLWRMVWQRRLLVLGLAVAGLLIGLVLSLQQTPLYRSTATLELNPPTIPVLNGGSDQNMMAPETDWDFLETQYGLLRSKALAEHVIEDLGLLQNTAGTARADPNYPTRLDKMADSIAREFEVDPISNSRLVEISYVSKDPQEAAKYVNAFADAFVGSTVERRYESAATARKFLEEQLATTRAALDESERKLVDYAQANGIITTGDGQSSDTGASLEGASLATMNDALAMAQQRRIAAEQRYRSLAGVSSTAEVSERTADLREEKAKLEAEYSEKSTYLGDNYPDMVRLRTRIQSLDQAIAAAATDVSSSRLNTLESEYRAALAEERQIQGRTGALKGSVLGLRERMIEYNVIKREVDSNRSLYDTLLERYNQVGVIGGINVPQAALVDRGGVPGAPFSPNIILNTSWGLLTGLVLGVGAAFLIALLTDTITTPDDVRKKLKLQVIGTVPKTKFREELAAAIADKRSAISEAYWSVVTWLQFSSGGANAKVLLVTSTAVGEGKSTSSLVMSGLLALNGKRVLLIDADLRKPSLAATGDEKGLSRLLAEDGDFQSHILKTSQEGLWLLPSGPISVDPVQLLNSDRAKRLFAQVRGMFDLIIIDAPPTHGFADSALLATHADATVMVVESAKTRTRMARSTIDRLKASNVPIIGVILTKYVFELFEYGYGYKYYAQYGNGKKSVRQHELAVGLLGPESGGYLIDQDAT